MPSKSLAKTLFPFAGASATQPRNKIRSSFSPLVGWLTSLWASKRQKKAKKNRSLVAEPHHSTSPVTVHEEPETPPFIDTTDGFGTTSRDDANGDDDHDASEMPHPLSQYFERRLTKEELDYAATALLEFLEEGKAASPRSGHEEYEYCTPVHTGRRLRHGLWSPESSLSVMYNHELYTNLSETDTLEMGEEYDRASLELARSACYVPDLRDSEDLYPYHFEFELEGEGRD